MQRFTKAGIVLIFLLYLIFGFFYLDIPSVKSDELWETSRAYYLKNHLHPGEPLLPKEIAPFFATIQELGWKSWFLGSLKFGTSAIVMAALPMDPLHANRMNGFLWSISVCLFTFMLAKKFGLNKWFALMCSALLIALPEFFQQVHRERPEMLLCSLLLAGILMLLKALDSDDDKTRKIWLLAAGLYAWLPSLVVHATGIVIPATLGIIYLIRERKNIFSLNTIIIGIGLGSGLLFFFYIKNSMGAYALSQGGTDFYDSHACPPIVCEGITYLARIPSIFYNKFVKTNVVSQPLSALIFILGSGFLVFSAWKKRKDEAAEKFIILFTGIAVPLLIMLLLSGSYGNYNVIVAPFAVIGVVMMLQTWLAEQANENSIVAKFIIPVLLLACLGSNVFGMQNQYAATREYKRVNAELRAAIPADANVMGMSLYYLPFRDQNYYSVTWFEPSVGKPGLTFAQAVRMKNINYVIADDAFASRANFRGKEWADTLVAFLETNATLTKQFDAKMYLKIIPDSMQIPVQFRYPEYEKGYVKRIRIYKINN
ncbi:MAG: hypothetical protein ABI763_00900 [Bacteroidota bacterium]